MDAAFVQFDLISDGELGLYYRDADALHPVTLRRIAADIFAALSSEAVQFQ